MLHLLPTEVAPPEHKLRTDLAVELHNFQSKTNMNSMCKTHILFLPSFAIGLSHRLRTTVAELIRNNHSISAARLVRFGDLLFLATWALISFKNLMQKLVNAVLHQRQRLLVQDALSRPLRSIPGQAASPGMGRGVLEALCVPFSDHNVRCTAAHVASSSCAGAR